ncbi:MAG: hypothetical protein V4510_09640 [bacterium]
MSTALAFVAGYLAHTLICWVWHGAQLDWACYVTSGRVQRPDDEPLPGALERAEARRPMVGGPGDVPLTEAEARFIADGCPIPPAARQPTMAETVEKINRRIESEIIFGPPPPPAKPAIMIRKEGSFGWRPGSHY